MSIWDRHSLKMKISKLFPNKEAFIVFALYIILFVFQGVFVTATKKDNGGYDYNTTLVVFLSELLKLVASATLYTVRKEAKISIPFLQSLRSWFIVRPTMKASRSKHHPWDGLSQCHSMNKPNIFKAVIINQKLLYLYFIPSLLYCFYNNLAFINLSHYDPTSYYILLQFRVVLTALLFQFLFKKKLTLIQWVSLGILTFGCMLKNFDAATTQAGDADIWSNVFNIYFLSINFQNFCSCLAGTYNEYLLKTQGASVDIFLQNVFMYLDSVLCNLVVLLFKGELGTIFNDFTPLGDIFVILIIVNSAIVGIVTSFFLKNLNSILKTYASALELIITAEVCYLIFGILITWYTILSICLVSIAVAMYFKNPVVNVTPSEAEAKDRPLLEDTGEEV